MMRSINQYSSRNDCDSDDSSYDEDDDNEVDNELLDSDEDEIDDEGQAYLESLQVINLIFFCFVHMLVIITFNN